MVESANGSAESTANTCALRRSVSHKYCDDEAHCVGYGYGGVDSTCSVHGPGIAHTTQSPWIGAFHPAMNITGADGDSRVLCVPVSTLGGECYLLVCHNSPPYCRPDNTRDNTPVAMVAHSDWGTLFVLHHLAATVSLI